MSLFPKSPRYYRIRKILIAGSPVWLILLLFIAVFIVENILGINRWREVRKEYLAEGFHLKLEDIPVPDRDPANTLWRRGLFHPFGIILQSQRLKMWSIGGQRIVSDCWGW